MEEHLPDKLQVHLLGAFDARLDAKSLAFSSDKLRALLTFLLLEDKPHRRDSLAGLLWGEMAPDKAATNLRLSLSRLRQSLEPFLSNFAEDEFLEVTRTTVQIHRNDACVVDSLVFDRLLSVVEAHPHDDLARCSVCAARLAQAVALYDGDFLAGLTLPDASFFDEWQVQQQESLHGRIISALDALIEHKIAIAAWDEAQRFAEQQLSLEPWREATYRQLMSVRLALDDSAGAVALYERCRATLAEELGATPTPQTVALYEQAKRLSAKASSSRRQSDADAPARPNNLPTQRLPFFGREAELRNLAALLIDPSYRLVTLMGMGGAGKTRLALVASRRVLNSFPDGVWFTPLAGVDGASATVRDDILAAIAAAVGYQFNGKSSEREQVLRFLSDKRMLLVLDNFEQLTSAADLLLDIMDAAQHLTLLVTSRERLLFQEEYAWLVDSLAIPPPGAADVSNYSSVELFVSRAALNPAGFALNAANRADVARICRMVDGIPLAIELAASWVFQMAPQAIAAAIEQNIDFLQTSMRNLPDRHRSMRAVFEGSWALLPAAEKQALGRLSVFRGSFSLNAAVHVAGLAEQEIASLSLKSLVVRRDGGRYEMHELLREYASEKLLDDQNLELTYSRFYLDNIGANAAELEGPQAKESLTALQLDSANLRAAWQIGVSRGQWPDLLAGTEPYSHYLWIQGLFREGARVFGSASQIAEQAQPAEGSVAHDTLASLLIEEARFLSALGRLDESLERVHYALSLVTDKQVGAMVRGQFTMALVLRRMGRFPESVEGLKEAAALAEGENMLLALAAIKADLGRAYVDQGYFREATRFLHEALDIYRGQQNVHGQSMTLNVLGMVARHQGDYEQAQSYYSQTLQVAQQADFREGIEAACSGLGLICEGLSQHSRALEYYRRSLEISRQTGDRWRENITLGNMGSPYLRYGDYEQAQKHFAAALNLSFELNDLQGQTWAYQQLSWVSYLRDDFVAAARYGELSLDVAHQINDRTNMAFAYLHLGYALVALDRAQEAIPLFANGVTLRREMNQIGLLRETMAGLAAAYLAMGQANKAREIVQEILPDLNPSRLAGTMQPIRIYWACYETLMAFGETARAKQVIAQAWNMLSEEANHIDTPDMRRSFLHNIPLHARISRLVQGEKYSRAS